MTIFVRPMVFISMVFTFFVATAIFLPTWAVAQEDVQRATQELKKIMTQEEPLNENDVRLYLTNADPIYRLRFEPDKLEETILAIGGWSEQRFTYVTIKMAVGMSQLMNPDDFRHQDVMGFAQPSPQELAVIMAHQDELNRVMERIQARYLASPPITQTN